MALTDKLIAIANAIRAKTGKTDGLTLDQMPTEIESIQSGGGGEVDYSSEDSLVMGTVTDYTNDRVASVGNYAFYSLGIKTARFPNVTSIGTQAFKACKSLTEIHAPKVTTIAGEAFSNCTVLAAVDFPLLETATQNYNFTGCSKLAEVVFPSYVGNIQRCMFQSCTSLQKAVFGSTGFTNSGYIDQQAFDNCQVLDTLVLASSEVYTLNNVNAFGKTPFASGGTGGTVYVPQALIASYQTATNWSVLYEAGSCEFIAIEGSEYE